MIDLDFFTQKRIIKYGRIPTFASQYDTVIDQKCPGSESEGATVKLPELEPKGDLETRKRIVKYGKIWSYTREKYSKVHCPICDLDNDGQCCHFVHKHGRHPALELFKMW